MESKSDRLKLLLSTIVSDVIEASGVLSPTINSGAVIDPHSVRAPVGGAVPPQAQADDEEESENDMWPDGHVTDV